MYNTQLLCFNTQLNSHYTPNYRDLSTLAGMFMLISENLIQAYNEGFPCEDTSIPHGRPGRYFRCKVCLLYVTGDYPALAKMTGFSHAGNFHCHWCMQNSQKDMAINRHNCGGFRRWLPANSTHRVGGGNFRRREDANPPPFRNHDDTVHMSVLAREWAGTAATHPTTTHGISTWCPLVQVPLFDLIWDVLGDFMHGTLWFPHHLVKAMKGETHIAAPKILRLQPKPANADNDWAGQASNDEKAKTNEVRKQRFAAAKKV